MHAATLDRLVSLHYAQTLRHSVIQEAFPSIKQPANQSTTTKSVSQLSGQLVNRPEVSVTGGQPISQTSICFLLTADGFMVNPELTH